MSNINFRGLVTFKQLAEKNGVSVATIRRWVKNGTLPRPIALVGNCLCWPEKQLEKIMVRKAAIAMHQAAQAERT